MTVKDIGGRPWGGAFPRIGFKTYFITALLLATLATVVLFPLFPKFFRPSASTPHLSYIILGWFSTAHVATSVLFYIDKDFLPHISQRKVRYIWTPLLFVFGAVIAYGVVGAENHKYLWLFFVSWLLWHYQRQNVGITSLVTATTKGERLSILERRLILAVGVSGIVAALRFKADSIPFLNAETLWNIGFYSYVGCCLIGAALILGRARRAPLQNAPSCLFIFASIAFFAPTFLQTGYYPAVTSYAVAHALQYWILMSYLSVSSSGSNGWMRSILGLGILVVALWGVIIYSRMGELWGSWANYLLGLQFGITMAHFVIDADAWRLSESFQRNYLRSRYKQLFSGA